MSMVQMAYALGQQHPTAQGPLSLPAYDEEEQEYDEEEEEYEEEAEEEDGDAPGDVEEATTGAQAKAALTKDNPKAPEAESEEQGPREKKHDKKRAASACNVHNASSSS